MLKISIIRKMGLVVFLSFVGCTQAPEVTVHLDPAQSAPATVESAEADDETDTESDETDMNDQNYNKLTDFEKYVILEKGTERPYIGKYTDLEDAGTYLCRQCNAQLYKSDHKFHSDCGWPAFDDEIEGAVERHPDVDGMRVEIVCSNCKGHLGHVFEGERLTEKNIRHCVNSVSMTFVPEGNDLPETIKKLAD